MERLDLTGERYTEPRNDRDWWMNGDPWNPATTQILVGVLPESGRWYARWIGPGPLRPGACVYLCINAEHYARATARRWMRTVGGTWVQA